MEDSSSIRRIVNAVKTLEAEHSNELCRMADTVLATVEKASSGPEDYLEGVVATSREAVLELVNRIGDEITDADRIVIDSLRVILGGLDEP